VCGSEIDHHGVHLVCIDGDAIPCHTIRGAAKVASLVVATVLYTCLGGIVEELIVANPEGSIPGLVSCPTVESGEGGSGHDLGSFGMEEFYRVRRSVAVADVPVARLALRGREGERATLSEGKAVGGRPCLHLVVAGGIVCHDGGEVDLGVGHGGCLN